MQTRHKTLLNNREEKPEEIMMQLSNANRKRVRDRSFGLKKDSLSDREVELKI
jgi:hypothetical protein